MLQRDLHNSNAKGREKVADLDPSTKSRYSLVLPEEVLAEIRRVAKKEDSTVLQVIRQFLKFGLTFYRMKEHDPNTQLIIRQGNSEQVVIWFWKSDFSAPLISAYEVNMRRKDKGEQRDETITKLDDLAGVYLPKDVLRGLDKEVKEVVFRVSRTKGDESFEMEFRVPAKLILIGILLAQYFPLK